ncbi:hypothetical protein TNCV_5013521 [Trichonephila clavipes]|nr:hypothetical protein TNCV_5013521 [Trichonephila clavipes]
MRQANQQFSSILTKIGNCEQLDEIKITLIESRFCIVKEDELRRESEWEICPVLSYDEKPKGSSVYLFTIPRTVTMVRRRERGHHVICIIFVKKLDDLPPLRCVDFPPSPLPPKASQHGRERKGGVLQYWGH